MSLFHKKSFGIICCKKTDQGYKLLIVNKGTTYAFMEFIHGKYKLNRVMYLLNRMTREEKMLIMSMNFSQMWYHVWLTKTKDRYVQSLNIFEANWSKRQDELKSAILNSTNGNTIWEFPKGRKATEDESPINCAVREFIEETGIPKYGFRVFDASLGISKTENRITYDTQYFFALANEELTLSPILGYHSTEICRVNWLSLNEINILCPSLKPIAKKAIKFVKNRSLGLIADNNFI